MPPPALLTGWPAVIPERSRYFVDSCYPQKANDALTVFWQVAVDQGFTQVWPQVKRLPLQAWTTVR